MKKPVDSAVHNLKLSTGAPCFFPLSTPIDTVMHREKAPPFLLTGKADLTTMMLILDVDEALDMKNLAENNLIRFINITKKKEGIYANFRVKGVRGGMMFSASISVDLDAADVDLTYPMEKIIEACAKVAKREFEKSELQSESLLAV